MNNDGSRRRKRGISGFPLGGFRFKWRGYRVKMKLGRGDKSVVWASTLTGVFSCQSKGIEHINGHKGSYIMYTPD